MVDVAQADIGCRSMASRMDRRYIFLIVLTSVDASAVISQGFFCALITHLVKTDEYTPSE
jgi:hypothetical protein